MLPIKDKAWYAARQKPYKAESTNFDMDTFREGLRIPEDDLKRLTSEMGPDMKQHDFDFGTLGVELRNHEAKEKVSAAMKDMIARNRVKYGWDIIAPEVLKDYLFEFAKYCHNKAKRASKTVIKKETPPPPAFPVASQSPQLCYRSPGEADSNATLGSPLIHPAALATSTKYPSLDSHTICVTRDDNGETYEDTIDHFQKPDTSGKGPNDYDFAVFKGELVKELQYNEQTETISYKNSKQGSLTIASDSNWRMALRNLSSQAFQAKSEELNFRIYKRVIPGALHGHHSPSQQSGNAAPIPASNDPLKAGLAAPIRNDSPKNGTAPADLKLPNTEEVSTPKDPSNAGSPTPDQQLANASPILTRNDPPKADKPGPHPISAETEKRTPLLGGRPNADQSAPNKTIGNLLKRNPQSDNRRRRNLKSPVSTPLQPLVDTPWRNPNMYKRDYEAEDDDESGEPQPPCERKRKTQNIEDEDTNDKPESSANNAPKNDRRSKDDDLIHEAAADGKATMVTYDDIDPQDVSKMLLEEPIHVEQRSRADFAPDFNLPLSKLTATDNIMLGNHDQ